jgi:hypothetical protein
MVAHNSVDGVTLIRPKKMPSHEIMLPPDSLRPATSRNLKNGQENMEGESGSK